MTISVVGWRAEGPSGFSIGGVGEDGDGCIRWSVAGGDDGELLLDAGKEKFSEGNTVAYQDKSVLFFLK